MEQETVIREERQMHRDAKPVPDVASEAPTHVYEKKKTLFRANQIVWYIAGLVDVLLLFRFLLKLIGANPAVGFTSLIYGVTSVFVAPFQGIVGITQAGNSLLEWPTVIAAIVYLCIAWGITYFLDIMYPITPRDVGSVGTK